MTSCKYGSFRARYIRLKPDNRINKNHRTEKYLTIGPKMQKTDDQIIIFSIPRVAHKSVHTLSSHFQGITNSRLATWF